MKKYAVEVLERYSHGKYGKEKYEVWCFSETSKNRAKAFASEIVAGMTWREILTDKYGEGSANISRMLIPYDCELDDEIGFENAEKCFSYRTTLL